jgi:serine-type D-Ala-D-Ala carboxypeptidase (penicillin-binding protein 5/6)
MKSQKKQIFSTAAIAVCAVLLAYSLTVSVRLYRFAHEKNIQALTEKEQLDLTKTLDTSYSDRNAVLRPLPYTTIPAKLAVAARSAIVIDTTNGNILYEKNADEIIPPASMTKLIVMYIVFQEIASGRISKKDIVPLPSNCWACNMPPHSSLMFLGKDQEVTLDELLTGLAVCSGNDAAYALADYISGSMDAFIKRMNDEMKALGLTHTYFVEASGYSAKNTTTAREMASFARVYITKYPEALSLYHSRLSYTYPQKQNLAPEDRGKPTVQYFSERLPEHITMGITQENTNKLLGKLTGCDGLKTGYIDESGYNLALTAVRGTTRYLSVTMGGPGSSVTEGNEYRIKDGTILMEWAFASFADSRKTDRLHPYLIRVTGAKSVYVKLVPVYIPSALTVPFITGSSPANAADKVSARINIPRWISGGTQAGIQYGSVDFYLGSTLLLSIPLVADRNIKKASAFVTAADIPIKLFIFNRR